MSDKTYEVKTTCPRCGCCETACLSEEEAQARLGSTERVETVCQSCREKYETPVQTACLEWDETCNLESRRFG